MEKKKNSWHKYTKTESEEKSSNGNAIVTSWRCYNCLFLCIYSSWRSAFFPVVFVFLFLVCVFRAHFPSHKAFFFSNKIIISSLYISFETLLQGALNQIFSACSCVFIKFTQKTSHLSEGAFKTVWESLRRICLENFLMHQYVEKSALRIYY